MDIEATTTKPSAGAEELPVIWLAPPEALLASDHTTKLYPVPIAVSATLLSLIFITLFILYNKKPRATDTQTHKTPTPSPTTLRCPPLHPSSASPTPPPLARIPQSNSPEPMPNDSAPPSRSSTPPHRLYHDYLHDSRYTSFQPSHDTQRSVSIDSYYQSPYETHSTAASSNYSVSVDETTFNSPRGSVYRREGEGGWTRLRLGSEYDGDRTFVPSEANLQLSNGNET